MLLLNHAIISITKGKIKILFFLNLLSHIFMKAANLQNFKEEIIGQWTVNFFCLLFLVFVCFFTFWALVLIICFRPSIFFLPFKYMISLLKIIYSSYIGATPISKPVTRQLCLGRGAVESAQALPLHHQVCLKTYFFSFKCLTLLCPSYL